MKKAGYSAFGLVSGEPRSLRSRGRYSPTASSTISIFAYSLSARVDP
jgi:hypothetical protein